jgi:hypothetical protein
VIPVVYLDEVVIHAVQLYEAVIHAVQLYEAGIGYSTKKAELPPTQSRPSL